MQSPLPIDLWVQTACVLEATARKPGNVHRYRDFDDLTYVDFLLSAAAISPVLQQAPKQPIGLTIYQAIVATHRVCRTNTNLGIVLLLTPLAAASAVGSIRQAIHLVLNSTTKEDARNVYAAIRLANPGGLGTCNEEDVHSEPTKTLLDVMKLAADRDMIARQYANGFQDLFDKGVSYLREAFSRKFSVENAIVFCHLNWLSDFPDSLIARKRGIAEARLASEKAREILDAGWPESAKARSLAESFDRWLSQPGQQRNPGTTADLVAATLFVCLCEGLLRFPLAWDRERRANTIGSG
ncbi:MAG: triphosphoribosyl-dephospho-CoA synthase [Gemmatales bacterium]|nr:MAG: triphosphoribosyl-dephospho-CoA synthase [Gemmatales bacterium]